MMILQKKFDDDLKHPFYSIVYNSGQHSSILAAFDPNLEAVNRTDVSYTNKANKQLEKLEQGNPKLYDQIMEAIHNLTKNPALCDVEKVQGTENEYRLRVPFVLF